MAIGASFAGRRALAAMKHVGLNVAADAFMSQAYIGVNGGLVLAVCDDPGIHSSQNEQDTRIYGQFATVPVLEPSDAQEALDFTRLAFELSETFDTMVIVRGTTRLSHTRSPVAVGDRQNRRRARFPREAGEERDDPRACPAAPRRRARARGEAEGVLRRIADQPLGRRATRASASSPPAPAIPTCARCCPTRACSKLGASWPLPEGLLRRYCESVERVFVVEELEPVIEKELRALGLKVEGKQFFPRVGEFSPEILRAGFEQAGVLEPRAQRRAWTPEPLVRPPVLCAGCPHTSSFMAVRASGARVAGDIGCYTLACLDPLRGLDTTVSMGSSIGNAIGMAKAGDTKPVMATIGDSTFLHAGIPALIDAVYNQANITVLLLDNHITAMTGGQEHPGTGKTLRGEHAPKVDYEALVRADRREMGAHRGLLRPRASVPDAARGDRPPRRRR